MRIFKVICKIPKVLCILIVQNAYYATRLAKFYANAKRYGIAVIHADKNMKINTKKIVKISKIY